MNIPTADAHAQGPPAKGESCVGSDTMRRRAAAECPLSDTHSAMSRPQTACKGGAIASTHGGHGGYENVQEDVSAKK